MVSLFGATWIVFSDASESGYGEYSVEVGPQFVHGSWCPIELNLERIESYLSGVVFLGVQVGPYCEVVYR